MIRQRISSTAQSFLIMVVSRFPVPAPRHETLSGARSSDNLGYFDDPWPSNPHRRESKMSGSVLDRFRLDGKVALITGGGAGSGKSNCRCIGLSGGGRRHHGPPGRNAAPSCRGYCDHVNSQSNRPGSRRHPAILRRRNGRRSTGKTLGRLDILVNNAGINIRGPIEELSEDDWGMVIDTNLKGPWLCCRAVAPGNEASEIGTGD